MANPKCSIVVKVRKLGRQFFARPCDDGRNPTWAWCVEEIEFKPDMSVRWASTLYEPVLSVHMRDIEKKPKLKFVHMTKAQAKREAVLWQRDYDAQGKGIPKKRGWRGSM
jgi:hypothetical protein